jgi:cytochrome P450
MDDLPQLRYTEMVFAEAMRLYPPAWAIGRMSKEAFELNGTRIAAKSICILSPYVVQHDPRWFPDPERFDPERWTPEARDARPKFSYFPFGGGARVCIGERFAWMEGALLLATLAQKWKLRPAPGQRVEPLPLITLRTKYGMRMNVISRAAEARP